MAEMVKVTAEIESMTTAHQDEIAALRNELEMSHKSKVDLGIHARHSPNASVDPSRIPIIMTPSV